MIVASLNSTVVRVFLSRFLTERMLLNQMVLPASMSVPLKFDRIAVLTAGLDSRVWRYYAVPLRQVFRVLLLPFTWSWTRASTVTEKLVAMSPLTTMRQVYLLWAYGLLGVSILAKGPPALAVGA